MKFDPNCRPLKLKLNFQCRIGIILTHGTYLQWFQQLVVLVSHILVLRENGQSFQNSLDSDSWRKEDKIVHNHCWCTFHRWNNFYIIWLPMLTEKTRKRSALKACRELVSVTWSLPLTQPSLRVGSSLGRDVSPSWRCCNGTRAWPALRSCIPACWTRGQFHKDTCSPNLQLVLGVLGGG